MGLFSSLPEAETAAGLQPLAERMRPRTLDGFIGQEKLLGPGKPLRVQIETDNLSSMLFWGPPGCGKTTLARLIARLTKAEFISFSAVLSGIKEIKEVMAVAEQKSRGGARTIVFVDEVHRFNKAQQDAFLPHVEAGHILFIGATTENPSFEVISPLLSRTKVYVLEAHTTPQLVELLRRALADKEHGLGNEQISIEDKEEAKRFITENTEIGKTSSHGSEEVLWRIAAFANGDARTAYNTLELCARSAEPDEHGVKRITAELLGNVLQRKMLRYDKAGEEHYNLISALHKSVRNSNPDAALYWLGRMLEAGEDPLYVARRVVRMAVEDIGLADPNALSLCMAARDAVDFIGMPEGNLALAQAVVYLSAAPKSNALYTAYSAVRQDVEQTAAESVPLHLRNAPTSLMKGLGYGKDYQYAHDVEGKVADMQCLPDNLKDRVYYRPTNEGVEKRIRERLQEVKRLRAKEEAAGHK